MFLHPAVLPLIYRMTGHGAALLTGAIGLIAVDFRDQITLGSIMVTVVIMAIAGLFTIRTKIANVWREEAEGERAAKERAQEELKQAAVERAEFERYQQELRHELKNQIAAQRHQIVALEAKTDLTVALENIREMNADLAGSFANQIAEVLATGSMRSEERDQRTHELLEEIRDRISPTDREGLE